MADRSDPLGALRYNALRPDVLPSGAPNPDATGWDVPESQFIVRNPKQ